MAKFADIPQFTIASYKVDVPWDFVEHWIENNIEIGIELDPDFQRAHVWDETKQIRYVEFILRNGRSSRDIYWNCPGWLHNFKGPLQLVDGKQRLEAVRRFMRNEIPAFGTLINDYEDRLRVTTATFAFHVNDLKTRAEVLKWYLDLNEGGVVHTEDELAKVRDLLYKEVCGDCP